MERLRHRIGKIVLSVCSLLLFGFTFAQTPAVTLKASQTTLAPQEPVTLTILSNVPGMIKIDYPVEFISDYTTADGMEQRLDPSTGRIITSHYLQQSGRFGKKGVYKFRASIKYHGKEVYSNYLTITVKDAMAPQGNVPVSLRNKPIAAVLELSKHTIYEGEAVLIRPRVYSTLDLKRFDNYSAAKPDAVVESHSFEQVNFELHRLQLEGKPVNSFEYGKELLFPVTVGTITFSPFEMVFEYQSNFFLKPIKARSLPVALKVKPLPAGAPASFIGGVGSFSLQSSVEKTELRQGEVFTVTCKISGTGNLQNVDEPKLVLPAGFQLYGDADRTEEVSYTENGAEGAVTYKIHVQVVKSGAHTFPGAAISWFNPATGKYETQQSQPVQLQVKADPSYQSTTVVQPPDVTSFKKKPAPTSVNWTLISLIAGSGIIVLALLWLLLRKRARTPVTEAPGTTVKTNPKPALPKAVEAVAMPPVSEPDYLEQARNALADPDEFASLLPKAIAQKVGARAGIAGNQQAVVSWLNERETTAATELMNIVELCGQYRYGFGAIPFEPVDVLRRTEELLTKL